VAPMISLSNQENIPLTDLVSLALNLTGGEASIPLRCLLGMGRTLKGMKGKEPIFKELEVVWD